MNTQLVIRWTAREQNISESTQTNDGKRIKGRDLRSISMPHGPQEDDGKEEEGEEDRDEQGDEGEEYREDNGEEAEVEQGEDKDEEGKQHKGEK